VQAVSIFTSTYDHRRVVEMCAPLGIDVMMEKPLATTSEDARAIAAAAAKGGIQVVVNYETTWYPSIQSAYGVIHGENRIGDLRRIVVHDGHEGPAVIGCSPYFMAWLTDPVLNGGGALMDFGCYGADLVTWLMEGQRPTSVFAAAQHFQPDVYPKVDDDATIVITYPKAVAILQASWNWPYDRKDMEIYGQKGALFLPTRDSLLLRPGRAPQVALPAPALKDPNADPLSYLAAVVRGEIKPSGPSGLEVNLVAMEILDAARESASTGRRVDFAAVAPK
jgi:predicted dehydrogenase